MDDELIEFQDFIEDFFNLELELEIDEEFVNAWKVFRANRLIWNCRWKSPFFSRSILCKFYNFWRLE